MFFQLKFWQTLKNCVKKNRYYDTNTVAQDVVVDVDIGVGVGIGITSQFYSLEWD